MSRPTNCQMRIVAKSGSSQHLGCQLTPSCCYKCFPSHISDVNKPKQLNMIHKWVIAKMTLKDGDGWKRKRRWRPMSRWDSVPGELINRSTFSTCCKRGSRGEYQEMMKLEASWPPAGGYVNDVCRLIDVCAHILSFLCKTSLLFTCMSGWESFFWPIRPLKLKTY